MFRAVRVRPISQLFAAQLKIAPNDPFLRIRLPGALVETAGVNFNGSPLPDGGQQNLVDLRPVLLIAGGREPRGT